ncbi:hypothetical protein MtrunA17_Chr3g0078911 [Medicago truncatula]|uniref:Uncharacterized protein n=1 Tax=Medicago truncatula TaxID=3880 RepID=A0A396IKS5_MEDTR|nr:hypothetical protein MtrunA17_Chr3g0078911 [Medicago truncatula]
MQYFREKKYIDHPFGTLFCTTADGFSLFKPFLKVVVVKECGGEIERSEGDLWPPLWWRSVTEVVVADEKERGSGGEIEMKNK